jgi:hypothetical protein
VKATYSPCKEQSTRGVRGEGPLFLPHPWHKLEKFHFRLIARLDVAARAAFAKEFVALHTLETMTQAQIDGQKFAELLLMEFPELRVEIQESQGLEHLQMMEFMLFTVRACERAEWATVEKCLRLADELLRLGDSKIKNAVYVSYLESLPRKGEVHDRLRKMMTSDQRKGWDEILAYLSKLSGS